jgi:hypothetical protein
VNPPGPLPFWRQFRERKNMGSVDDGTGKAVFFNDATFTRVEHRRRQPTELMVLAAPGIFETLFKTAEQPVDRLIIGEATYPAWAGVRRRWIPFRLWEWATASRRLGRSRFVRWLLNRTTWRHP